MGWLRGCSLFANQTPSPLVVLTQPLGLSQRRAVPPSWRARPGSEEMREELSGCWPWPCVQKAWVLLRSKSQPDDTRPGLGDLQVPGSSSTEMSLLWELRGLSREPQFIAHTLQSE